MNHKQLEDVKVGDRLYLVSRYAPFNYCNCELEVTKAGRKYIHLQKGYKITKDYNKEQPPWNEFDGNYLIYPSKEFYEEMNAEREKKDTLNMKIVTELRGMSSSQLQEILQFIKDRKFSQSENIE